MSIVSTERGVLRAALLANAEMLADAVIDALSAAGGEPEWDSEIIESVLQPFSKIVKRAGMPWVGSTSDDNEAVNRWRRMTPQWWDEICVECGEEGHDCNARECDNCGDEVQHLSTRDWCDGCEEEAADLPDGRVGS